MNRPHIKTWFTLTICAVLVSSCNKLDLKAACFSPYVDFVAYNVNPSTLQVSFNSITTFNGTISSYNWEFGDSTSYIGQTPPVHTYPALSSANPSKTYRIKLTVANECGSSYWTKDIVVGPCLATVKFTASPSGNVVTFTNQSTSSTPTTYNWNFGDGTNLTTSTTTFSHTYPSGGTYQVVLKASNSCGDNFSTVQVNVCNGVGTLNPFSYFIDDLTLTNISSSAVTNATSYLWNFGDSTTSNLQNPGTKTYSSPGQYTFSLTVSNSCSSNNLSVLLNVPNTSNSINTPSTNFLAVCALSPNNVYYVASNGSFYRFDGNTFTWTSLGIIPISADANTKLVRDHAYNIWIYGTGGVAKWNGSSWSTITSSSLGYVLGAIIQDIDFDGRNNLWTTSGNQIRMGSTLKVTTSTFVNSLKFSSANSTPLIWWVQSGVTGLYRINTTTAAITTTTVTNLSTNSSNIEVDSLTGNLYIASNAGIVRTDRDGIYQYYYNSANTANLNAPPIKMEIDLKGYLWVLKSKGGDFIRISKNLGSPDAKLYNVIPSINFINDFSVISVDGNNSNYDIFLAKSQSNAAIRIF